MLCKNTLKLIKIIKKFIKIALTIQINCFSPTLKFLPSSDKLLKSLLKNIRGDNMSEELALAVKDAVSVVNDPHMGVSIVEMGIVQSIAIDGSTAELVIKPTNPGCMSVTRIAAQAKAEALKVEGIDKVKLIIEGHVMADALNEMLNKDN